jgi:hypothetical protein
VLAFAILVYQQTTATDRTFRDVLQPFLAGALCVGLTAYFLVMTGAPISTFLPAHFQTFTLPLVLALGYSRLRGLELRFALPERLRESDLLLAATIPAALALVAIVTLAFISPLGVREYFHVGSTGPLQYFIQGSLSTILFAIGTAVLFFGTIQEDLRTITSSGAGIVGVIVLVGFYREVSDYLMSLVDVPLPVMAVFVLIPTGSVLVAYAVLWVWESQVQPTFEPGPYFGLPVLVGPLLFFGVGIGTGLLEGSQEAMIREFVFALTGVTTTAIAAFTYERTGSFWPPAVAFASGSLTIDVVVYLLINVFG